MQALPGPSTPIVTRYSIRTDRRHLITLYVGSGTQTEKSFRAPASTWKISYTWNCSTYGYSGNMIITVYRSNGDYYNLAANRLALSGSGRTYVHGSGKFYLEMDSECDWRVTVTR